MILDNIPNELLLLLNFYSANLNFRSIDSYLEENISRYQAEVSYASRLRCSKSVHSTIAAFSNELNEQWPKDVKKHYLKKLYIAQIDTKNIDFIKHVEYLAIQTVKQILPLVFKDYPDIAESCSNVSTLKEAKDAASVAVYAAHSCYVAIYDATGEASAASAYAVYAAADAADIAATDAGVICAVYDAAGEPRAYDMYDAADAVANTFVNAYAASDVAADKLQILKISIQIGIDSLNKSKSNNCKYLYLYM